MPEDRSGLNTLPCDLLVFDLDGTLIDSQQDLANTVNATLAFLTRPQLSSGQIATFVGDGAATLMQRSLEATAQPGEALEPLMAAAMPFFLEYYREHKLDFTYVYPGVLSELRKLREVAPHMLMAVLTNKPFRPARLICDALGLSPYFFQNYGGDSFPQKKPHPMGMTSLMDEAASLSSHTILPDRVVLVGDSHVDVETARAAHVRCLGCTYGLSTERLLAAGPDALVDSPTGWLAALKTMLV
jgi:phosphoglycolate phosphatase